MLSTDRYLEGQNDHIVNFDTDTIKPDVLEKVLLHIYGEDVELSFENILEVLNFATMTLLDQLKEECLKALGRLVNDTNALQIYLATQLFDQTGVLRDTCERYLCKMLDENKVENFGELPLSLVERYFFDYQCKVESEKTVVLRIMEWLKYDWENRINDLSRLRLCVRFVDEDEYLDELVAEHVTSNGLPPPPPANEDPSYKIMLTPPRCNSVEATDSLRLVFQRNDKVEIIWFKLDGFNDELTVTKSLKLFEFYDKADDIVFTRNEAFKSINGQWCFWDGEDGVKDSISGPLKLLHYPSSKGNIILVYYEKGDFEIKLATCESGKFVILQSTAVDVPKAKGCGLAVKIEFAFSGDKLFLFTFYKRWESQVFVLDLKTFKVICGKSFRLPFGRLRVLTSAKVFDSFVLFSVDKCYLFDLVNIASTDEANASITYVTFNVPRNTNGSDFSLEPSHTAAAVIGNLLIVIKTLPNTGISIYSCDFNQVLRPFSRTKEGSLSVEWKDLSCDKICRAPFRKRSSSSSENRVYFRWIHLERCLCCCRKTDKACQTSS